MKFPPLLLAFVFVLKLDIISSWAKIDEVFTSWSIDIDEDHNCKLTAHTPEPIIVDRQSLFLKLNDAIDKVNPNMSMISIRTPDSDDSDEDEDFEDDFEDLDKKEDFAYTYYDDHNEEKFLRTKWKVKACYSACKDALSSACSVYNCKNIKEKFKSYCKRNCKDMFC